MNIFSYHKKQLMARSFGVVQAIRSVMGRGISNKGAL